MDSLSILELNDLINEFGIQEDRQDYSPRKHIRLRDANMANRWSAYLPVLAILIVVFSMTAVNILIIHEPFRILSAIPIMFVVVLWGATRAALERKENVR